MFAQWTGRGGVVGGDVRVHAGYNTLWDGVINRRQKRVDVQGVQVGGKSQRVALQTGES